MKEFFVAASSNSIKHRCVTHLYVWNMKQQFRSSRVYQLKKLFEHKNT